MYMDRTFELAYSKYTVHSYLYKYGNRFLRLSEKPHSLVKGLEVYEQI